ncbi:MAG TPA: response regulator [Blastocatellia bacterium]|nr:response regulator [Blastocatellia bacterium]
MRILCVEDDADSREVITILLGLWGYEVVTASSPTDGLELAQQDSFALIILDNWYEIGSGLELCKQIRGFDTNTPIIFYSASAYEVDVQKAMEAGAQGYLFKPTEIEVMVQTIEGLTKPAKRQLAFVQ